MSDRALIWAEGLDIEDGKARDVLRALAGYHSDDGAAGGICLPTTDLCAMCGHDLLTVAACLWWLRNKGLIRADGIGGLMSVELGCDFEGAGVDGEGLV